MRRLDATSRSVPAFCERLDALRALRGNDVVNAWQAAAKSGHIERVVRELLVDHYDPVYLTSMQRNFADFGNALLVEPLNGDAGTLREVASSLRKT